MKLRLSIVYAKYFLLTGSISLFHWEANSLGSNAKNKQKKDL